MALFNGTVKDLKAENLKLLDATAAVDELDAFEAELGFNVGDRCGPQGRFLLEAQLGEGSFATVHRAKDGEKLYAVKFAKATEQTRRALEKEVGRPKGGSSRPFKAYCSYHLHEHSLKFYTIPDSTWPSRWRKFLPYKTYRTPTERL